MRKTVAALAALFATSWIGMAAAQTWQDKPISILIPAPPGGGTDIVARLFAEPLSREIGRQILIDNKGGGNGNIATLAAARAKPDGHTLLMQYSGTHVANPALIPDLNWHPVKDFAPVAMAAMAPHLITIAKKLPPTDLKSFIAYAKANPGKLNAATVGPGSIPHIGAVMLNKAAGLDLTAVHYKGSGPASQDLLAGQIEVFVVTPPSIAAHVRSGAIKGLALASGKRLPSFPDVPTTEEAGLPGFTLEAWFALFAPAGTPKELVDKLNAAMRKVATSPEMKAKLADLGLFGQDWSSAEFGTFVAKEVDFWGKTIRDAGIKLE